MGDWSKAEDRDAQNRSNERVLIMAQQQEILLHQVKALRAAVDHHQTSIEDFLNRIVELEELVLPRLSESDEVRT